MQSELMVRVEIYIASNGDTVARSDSNIQQHFRSARCIRRLYEFFHLSELEQAMLGKGSVLTFQITEEAWDKLNRSL